MSPLRGDAVRTPVQKGKVPYAQVIPAAARKDDAQAVFTLMSLDSDKEQSASLTSEGVRN